MKSIVLNPDYFFKEQVNNPNRLISILIVSLASLSSISGTYYLMYRLIRESPEGLNVFIALGGSIGLFSSVLTIFLFWFVYSISFHFAAGRLGGSGDFRKTFFLAGYGFLPLVFSGIVGFTAVYMVSSAIIIPNNPEAFDTLVTALENASIVRVGRLIGSVFLLWSGVLWAFMIKHVYELDLTRATVPAAIPTVVSIIWELTQAF